MKQKMLTKCPKCNVDFKNMDVSEYQQCFQCGYWTRNGTLRLDPILIFD